MKALFFFAALAAASVPAMAQTNVSISVGQPGFYGRIDLGDRAYYGPPPVYVTQPVIIERHRHVRAEPVYLRVPPGHRKNWSKHCRKYGACGQPVLFVQDRWYADVYAPRYRERHGHHDRYDDRRHGRDRHDDRHDRGHGRGHDRGHDRHDDRGHGRGH